MSLWFLHVSSEFLWVQVKLSRMTKYPDHPLAIHFLIRKYTPTLKGFPDSPVTLIPQASAPWEAPYGWGGPKACSWNRYCCGKGWWLEAPPKPLVIGMLGNGRNHKNTSIIINPLVSCAARNLKNFKGNKGASRVEVLQPEFSFEGGSFPSEPPFWIFLGWGKRLEPQQLVPKTHCWVTYPP